jgi:hypothetical protein
MISRRRLLKQIVLAGSLKDVLAAGELDKGKGAAPISPDDDRFLEDVEKASFLFFWEQTDPKTGLVKDRANARINQDQGIVASIAATGFGLTAMCIGHKRGYASALPIVLRVVDALEFLWKKMPTHRGFYFHWANVNTGERIWESEVSSIDTAILLCGVLSCREYFGSSHPGIANLATAIFNRVDWSWLAEDTSLLSHGWIPETGFLPYRWDNYSELMMMYLLGLGSSTFPLPDGSWTAWKRTTFDYEGMRYVGSFAPLFVHQYSQAWFDLRGKRDKYADYFENSVISTKVHKRFCIELHSRFPDYGEDLWGITASDSQHGYVVWGGPPEIGPIDGTVVPSASGGSLPFLPDDSLRVLKNIRNNYVSAWCRYGFVNALNPLTKWYDTDVIGIDTGITMVMAENLRTGLVWEYFMKNREVQRGLERAGFHGEG